MDLEDPLVGRGGYPLDHRIQPGVVIIRSGKDPEEPAGRVQLCPQLLAPAKRERYRAVSREKRGRGTFAAPQPLIKLLRQAADKQRVESEGV
jgi:hypothetical protein